MKARNRSTFFSFRRGLGVALIAGFSLLLGGCGVPSFLITPVSSSSSLEEQEVQSGKGWSPKKIVIIEVEGMLLNAKGGGLFQATENDVSRFTQQLDKAASDSSVVAVVLRINSPGGTVSASDTMYEQVKRFKAKTHKPVIASAQDMAASGAYYVACACDKIVVQPTSVVGSIGVIFNTFDASGTMSKIGLRAEAIKSGPLKDMGSPFKPIGDQERVVMQTMVDDLYARFLGVVKDARPIKEADFKMCTDGRVFTGNDAVRLGLADKAGLLDDALDLARETTGAKTAKVVLYKRPYGYSGSIYADAPARPPQASVFNINLPNSRFFQPTGFYYVWEP